VADEFVTQLLRQGNAKVFKKYSQMKLQMKREVLAKLNRQASETGLSFGTATKKGALAAPGRSRHVGDPACCGPLFTRDNRHLYTTAWSARPFAKC